MPKKKRKAEKDAGPVRVFEAKKDTPRKPKNEKDMRAMAGHVVEHRTKPYPQAEWPQFDPFPRPLLQGLAWGTLVGILLEVLWAALMNNGALVIPGWDGLFSMTPFTFYVFWSMVGAAFGIIVIGVAFILITPVPRSSEELQEERINNRTT